MWSAGGGIGARRDRWGHSREGTFGESGTTDPLFLIAEAEIDERGDKEVDKQASGRGWTKIDKCMWRWRAGLEVARRSFRIRDWVPIWAARPMTKNIEGTS